MLQRSRVCLMPFLLAGDVLSSATLTLPSLEGSVLEQMPQIAEREIRLREVEQIVRARLNLQGTMMSFSTERNDGLWWLMVSPDVNAVRMLWLVLQNPAWKEEVPRLMRGLLQRQRRGVWDLTVANAWGVLAVERFSQLFEATSATGTTKAQVAEVIQEVVWTAQPHGKTLTFPWPGQQQQLIVDHVGTGRPWVTL